MVKEKIYPRIHVLLARDAQVGLVIRRGPSKQVCTFLWNRKKNEFHIGQWFKGRIYEKRSDLSPDGESWIYFAMNGKPSSEVEGSWTAIAKTPYLKAVALFSKDNCWHGGGLFLNNKEYWLNDGYGHKVVTQSSMVKRDMNYQPSHNFGGECFHVYFNRLLRDQWKMKEHQEAESFPDADIFEKQIEKGWKLQKIAHAGSKEGKGVYWDEHRLVNQDCQVTEQHNWEWAEWADGHLYWAEKGCLYQGGIVNTKELKPAKLLHDFNEYKFKRLHAPY